MVIARVTIANIIANQRQVHQQLLIRLRVASQRVHQTHRRRDACSINTNILEIIGVTTVTSSELRVDRGGVGDICAWNRVLVGASSVMHTTHNPIESLRKEE